MTPHAHDLLWVKRILIDDTTGHNDWFLSHNPLLPVVVRRDRHRSLIPVGIRGRERHQRLAAWVEPCHITKRVTPRQLVQSPRVQQVWRTHALEVFRCLDEVARVCHEHQVPWGITGSLGYELATGVPCARSGSDIDISLPLFHPVSDERLASLSSHLDALSCRVDAQIETSIGAFSLRERVSGTGRVLLKTSAGPLLTLEPWTAIAEVPEAPPAIPARLRRI